MTENSNENVKVLSKSDADTVRECMTRLLPIFRAAGTAPGAKKDLGATLEACDERDIVALGQRAGEALNLFDQERREAAYKEVRVAVRKLVDTKVKAHLAARATIMALPADTLAMLAKEAIPSGAHVVINVIDLLSAFPRGTNAEQAHKILRDESLGFGYEGVKGNTEKTGPRIKVAIAPEKPVSPTGTDTGATVTTEAAPAT